MDTKKGKVTEMENKYFTEKGIREAIEKLTAMLNTDIAEAEVLYKYDCYTEYITVMDEIARLADEISDLANRLDD